MEKEKTVSRKREQWAWYLYDFGNSAYAAVILLAVFSRYFKEGVVGTPEASMLWGLSLTIAMLVVAVISPFLGAIADFSQKKKLFLFIMTSISVTFTALLFLVESGDILMAMVFFIFAEIGYRGAQVFYNALLIDVADPDEIGKVSGNGWAVGSLGGIVCLIIVLVLIKGNPGDTFIVRLSMVITAAYFAIFAIPLFVTVKEKTKAQDRNGRGYYQIAVDRLRNTIKSVRNFKEFLKYMAALLIYNDGIIAALNFAAIIGLVLFKVTAEELIIFVIIVQVTGIFGAWMYGWIAEKIGFKNSLLQSLLLMLVAVIIMFFLEGKTAFFIVGALAGFAISGVQSVSRSMVGVFAPPGKTAEFYGFFALAGRTSSVIGPGVMGLIATGATNWVMDSFVNSNIIAAENADALIISEQIGTRLAIISIIFFLVMGTLLLLFVNEEEGRKQAKTGMIEA